MTLAGPLDFGGSIPVVRIAEARDGKGSTFPFSSTEWSRFTRLNRAAPL